AEVVAVAHRPGARRCADACRGLLRRERRRGHQQPEGAFHGGRLKMIVMPFTTEMIDGTPSASGVSWRSIVGAPDVTPPACAIASPSVGTTSSDVDDSTPPLDRSEEHTSELQSR